jgi:hypothetical protein
MVWHPIQAVSFPQLFAGVFGGISSSDFGVFLAVSEILCVDRVYLGSLFGISELIPKISNQIGWQIG